MLPLSSSVRYSRHLLLLSSPPLPPCSSFRYLVHDAHDRIASQTKCEQEKMMREIKARGRCARECETVFRERDNCVYILLLIENVGYIGGDCEKNVVVQSNFTWWHVRDTVLVFGAKPVWLLQVPIASCIVWCVGRGNCLKESFWIIESFRRSK